MSKGKFNNYDKSQQNITGGVGGGVETIITATSTNNSNNQNYYFESTSDSNKYAVYTKSGRCKTIKIRKPVLNLFNDHQMTDEKHKTSSSTGASSVSTTTDPSIDNNKQQQSVRKRAEDYFINNKESITN